MIPKLTVVAPASGMELSSQDKETIADSVETLGYRIDWGAHLDDCERFLAGSDANRAQDLMRAFQNPQTKVILAVRGGYGCARLLKKLDWNIIHRNPKVFVGFSDTTVLQNALLAKAKLTSVTGFLAKFWVQKPKIQLLNSLRAVIDGSSVVLNNLPALTHGSAQGVMVGGCLSSFVSMLGTPYLPNLKGKILLLEEVGEQPYVLDSMFTQLENAGVFDVLSGVVLGDFSRCISTPQNAGDGSMEQVLLEHFSKLKIPVVFSIPYSHETKKIILPFGTKTFIDADKGIVCVDGLKKKW